MDLAYNGAPFHGFARQADVRTVQGDIESALARLLRREVVSTGAGRTDAGVHARGQVVSVPGAPDELDIGRLVTSLNGILGPSIAISRGMKASESFNARRSARSRLYVYAVLQRPVPDPFLASTTLWHRHPLDVEAMIEAAGHLIGPHDFSSFGRVDAGASAERNLFELRCRSDGDLVRVRVRANAFIQQMVRSLVGTLVEVGEGRRSPDEMPDVLASRDRSTAGPVAPPHGLCLVAVEYDEGWSHPHPSF